MIRIKNIFRFATLGLLIGAFIVGSIPLRTVSAQEQTGCDESYYASNNVEFFNPCSTTCSSAAPGGVSAVTKLNGKDNREKIYNYWLTQQMTPAQAAGIAGSIQHESGFSPFRQEMSQSWPAGGWGIAQFTFGQRTAATDWVKKEVGDDLFNQYYKNDYGGGVSESSGFVPAGVPPEVNDQFLLAELNYLANYTGGFAPSTISARVNGIKNDYNQDVPKGMKLLEYLKTLSSANDVAIAWTYLYEYPGDIKNTARDRGVSAESLLILLGGNSTSSACDTVGAGGLTYEQGVKLMNYWLVHRNDNDDLGNYGISSLLYQCTAFSYWFTTKFVAGSRDGNGGDVAGNLLAEAPSGYKSVTADAIQPYTVFSIQGVADGYGHTGVVVGVGTDKSVVIAESNVRENSYPAGTTGLKAVEYIHDDKNNWKPGRRAGLYVTHWNSIQDWEKFWQGTRYIYAAPADAASTATKVQDYMGKI